MLHCDRPDQYYLYVTEIPGLNYKDVGNLYGCIELGRIWFKSKQKLGWAEGRLTKYQDIEEWWEMVCSSYLLVSLFAELQINSEKLAPLFRVLELEET